jgi:hypothetical protein
MQLLGVEDPAREVEDITNDSFQSKTPLSFGKGEGAGGEGEPNSFPSKNLNESS